jgi:hypothetical protein
VILLLFTEAIPNKAVIPRKDEQNAVWRHRPRIFSKNFSTLDHLDE